MSTKVSLLNLRLHVLSRFKGDNVLFWHNHLIACPWVACPSGCPRLDFENAEIPQLDSALANESVNDRIESPLDDLLGLLLCEAYFVRNRADDVFFCHSRLPLDLRRPNLA